VTVRRQSLFRIAPHRDGRVKTRPQSASRKVIERKRVTERAKHAAGVRMRFATISPASVLSR
jgi:hypothetical protein